MDIMLRGKDLIGLNVFSIRSDQSLEIVSDVIYDSETKKALVLCVEMENEEDKEQFIEFAEIINIRPQSVIVSGKNVLKKKRHKLCLRQENQ